MLQVIIGVGSLKTVVGNGESVPDTQHLSSKLFNRFYFD